MSQIIPLGIGSPADINRLVLTGLSISIVPPPVPSEIAASGSVIGPGQVAYSFDSFYSAVDTNGTAFALLSRAVQVTWQTIYEVAPSVADIIIQISLDNSNWTTVDESISVDGDLRTFKTSARFIRARMLTMDVGVVTSVLIRVQPTESWF